MLYLERAPHPALAPYVWRLWYCSQADGPRHREIVLPSGRLEIVISLARDYLTDCGDHLDGPSSRSSAALLVGVYSHYQVIDSSDLSGLIGVVFRPGGATPFFEDRMQLFTNCETPLEDLWGCSMRALRDRLREAATPEAKFSLLEGSLLERLSRTLHPERNRVVDFALTKLHGSRGVATVGGLTRETGLSARRLLQLFDEHVGVSPKLYCRIQRFQLAVRRLHRGDDLPWAELALGCGYYDQSHFANDFRAFSGISPTTYSSAQRPWANHVAIALD
jgi:AraC-like DNA-binding protein